MGCAGQRILDGCPACCRCGARGFVHSLRGTTEFLGSHASGIALSCPTDHLSRGPSACGDAPPTAIPHGVSHPKRRRTAVVTAWTLAAAAVLVGAPSWVNWRASRNRNVAVRPDTPVLNGSPTGQNAAAESQSVMADSELSDFTLLPGVLPADTDDAAIVRVRLQRGALGALGLPVNEDRANEWIQVDLLVGNDGLPEAVRMRE